MVNQKTNDFDLNSKLYFKDISNSKPLTKREEFALWKRYKKDNDIEARNKLVEANLKFVVDVAKNYRGRGLSYADLVEEGNMGLIKALDRFDGDKGYKVISYSVWWIKQSILEAIEKRNGLPAEELPQDYEKQGGSDEYEEMENAYAIIDECDYNSSKKKDIKETTKLLLSSLTEREMDIVSEYYGLNNEKPKTLEEIGDKYGLTKERVRQLNEKALKKLRAVALHNSITSDIYKG